MATHTHFTCEHELKFCKECDIPYCGKCGKEWGKEKPSANSFPLPPLIPALPRVPIQEDNIPRVVPINNELIRTVNMEIGQKPS